MVGAAYPARKIRHDWATDVIDDQYNNYLWFGLALIVSDADQGKFLLRLLILLPARDGRQRRAKGLTWLENLIWSSLD